MPNLYNTSQAAEELTVSYEWLRRQVTAGKVPHVRLGRLVRFTDEHIQDILLSRTVRPAKPKSRARTTL